MKRVLAANLLLLALVVWGFYGEYSRNRELQEEIDALDARAAEVERRNLELEELGRRFDSSEVFERDARLKLNLRKPGEEVVVIRGEMSARELSEVPEEGRPRQQGLSNLKKWLKRLLGPPDGDIREDNEEDNNEENNDE